MSARLLNVETVETSDLVIGLSSWVIADGNYSKFERGDRTSFAVTFYAPDSLSIPSDHLLIDPPGVNRSSMQHLEGSCYLVTARVTHMFDYDGWWVIDAGILMYSAVKPTDGIKAGCWVRGKIVLGVDPFEYVEHLSRYYAAPALIYDWDVKKIEIETTPIIESGRMSARDQTRRGWKEVGDTKARTGAFCEEFVLHCTKLDTPPRR